MAAAPLVTQTELVNRLQDHAPYAASVIKEVLKGLEIVTEEAIGNVERVKVAGVTVGPAIRPARKARMGRNPATGEEIRIERKPASVAVKARVSKRLKDAAPNVQKAKRRL